VYRGLKNVVEEDLDTVARLLSELDPLGEELEQVRRASAPLTRLRSLTGAIL